jgi:hypothetical protein
VTTDPVKIASIQSLVKKSIWRKKNQIKPRLSPRFTQSCLSDLPFDLKWMILDLLDHKDIFTIQSAIYLYIEESYWRLRTSKMVIFEIQDVPPEKLDWEFLCPRLEELASSGILHNRHRIVQILRGTKNVFQKLGRDGKPILVTSA